MALPVRKLQWGQLGPAMRALPSDRWRDFVFYYLTGEPGHGSQANAARKAGFGKPNSTPQVFAQRRPRTATEGVPYSSHSILPLDDDIA